MQQAATATAEVLSAPSVLRVRGLVRAVRNKILVDEMRRADVSTSNVAFYLHDMQESGDHQLDGHAKASQWAEANLGLADSTARALVGAGARLEELKQTDAAFVNGQLSWSKVQRIAMIATPETEAAWIEAAKANSCRKLERMITAARLRGDLVPRQDRIGLPEPKFTFRVCMDALERAKLELAKEKLSREQGRSVGDEELLQLAVEALLRAAPQPAEVGDAAERTRHDSLYRVVVQRCPTCGDAAVQTRDGAVEITPEAAAVACCDAPVHDPERTGQNDEAPATPGWLREAVLARDGYRCRCCGARRGVQAHHIVLRSQGGATNAKNLLSLCAACHGRFHAGLLRIRGDAGAPVFCDRDWRPIHEQVRFTAAQFVGNAASREARACASSCPRPRAPMTTAMSSRNHRTHRLAGNTGRRRDRRTRTVVGRRCDAHGRDGRVPHRRVRRPRRSRHLGHATLEVLVLDAASGAPIVLVQVSAGGGAWSKQARADGGGEIMLSVPAEPLRVRVWPRRFESPEVQRARVIRALRGELADWEAAMLDVGVVAPPFDGVRALVLPSGYDE